MYQLVLTLICCPSLLIDAFDFDPTNFQLSGRAMAANNRFVIAIQNRSIVSFSAVKNYTTTSPKFCSLEYNATNVTDLYPMMVAVPREVTNSNDPDSFVFVGYSRINATIYLVLNTIDFRTCELDSSEPLNVSKTDYPKYSTLGIDPNGGWVFYFWEDNVHVERFDLTGPRQNVVFGNITRDVFFYPVAVDFRGTSGILAGYPGIGGSRPEDTILRPVVYQFTYVSCPSTSCFQKTQQWAVPRNIKTYAAIPSVALFLEKDYKPLYDISVSISDTNVVLVGIQALNTVFRLNGAQISSGPIDSRTMSSGVSVGFGKSVGWLDATTAVVLFNAWEKLYRGWRSSRIDLYTLNSSVSLSNRQPAYAYFPNTLRKLWSTLKPQIIELICVPSTGSLIIMDVNGLVQIIRPSLIGQYPQTSSGTGTKNTTIYYAPTPACPAGMYKGNASIGKDLFLACDLCSSGTYRAASSANASRCTACNSTTRFCPTGATNDFSPDALYSEIQIQAYPESPDNDVLEDIMLTNIFDISFPQHCLLKQPLFWGLIIIGIGVAIMILMAVLKLTKRFPRLRETLRNVFQQTDLIGEGEVMETSIPSLSLYIRSASRSSYGLEVSPRLLCWSFAFSAIDSPVPS